MTRPIAIYAGYLVRFPLGGHVLAELHHIAGLKRLGYQVIVVEESGSSWAPCFHPIQNQMTNDPSYGLDTLRFELGRLGMEADWCYVDAEGRYHGLSQGELRALCRRAALLFSRAGVTWLDEFYECRKRL